MNTSRSKTVILIAGCAVIVLAAALFVAALSIADFGVEGGGLFSGRSKVLLVVSFVLLAGVATVLLFAVTWTEQTGTGVVPAEKTDATETTEPADRETAEEPAPTGVETAPAPSEPSSAILAETAGELRTSVEVIQEELEEILEDEAPADREHVQSLYDETDRLKKIIASMEVLSRVPAIAQADAKEELPIEPLLREIIDVTRAAVPGKDVTYLLECEPGLAGACNREAVTRIIGNIADNAARSIRGSGTVTLTAARQGDTVVFSVKDTGTGIRRAQLSHIYEHFFRGTGAGIGMGLSIAKELADACGGTIAVKTAVNKGTTFTVTLPLGTA